MKATDVRGKNSLFSEIMRANGKSVAGLLYERVLSVLNALQVVHVACDVLCTMKRTVANESRTDNNLQ
jgi:hypothetical protein